MNARRLISTPAVAVAAILAVVLLLAWQFITDASRAIPALDTAWYQWRAEFLGANDPGALVLLEGARGALAGGYRVAEPVLAALMRAVGGVGADTPTVVLSVGFRVLAAIGMAAFAWRHRGSWLLFYLSLLTIPALFLLQQFFGFLDNFMALALLAGVLLLLGKLRTSWTARAGVVALLFLTGMSHPTTLVLFLLSMGAVIGWRVLRERSVKRGVVLESPILAAGTVAVFLTAAFWLGGLWGPTAGFGEAAVPPPEDVSFFVDRSLGVLEGMYPWILIPVMILGLGALVVSLFRDGERFAELTLAWALPLGGVFGFLIGAAYPYFRFFNATLSPLLATAVGFALLIGLAARAAPRPLGRLAPATVGALVAVVLGFWWSSGLSQWNQKPSWNTPEVRTTMAGASTYLEREPGGRRALFVVDAQPEGIVPYGKYKEFTNSIYAGLDGEQIDQTLIFFGTIDDLRAGRASRADDAPYNDISSDTASAVLPALSRHAGNLVVFVPSVFNEPSPNMDTVQACADCPQVGDTGLYLEPELGATPVSEDGAAAALAAARGARSFTADPPGPLSDLGGTVPAILRLGLLFLVPGWLLYRRLPDRAWVEGLALVPLLSLAAATTVGMAVVAVVRGPLTPGVGWASWGIATALALAPWAWDRARRTARIERPT